MPRKMAFPLDKCWNKNLVDLKDKLSFSSENWESFHLEEMLYKLNPLSPPSLNRKADLCLWLHSISDQPGWLCGSELASQSSKFGTRWASQVALAMDTLKFITGYKAYIPIFWLAGLAIERRPSLWVKWVSQSCPALLLHGVCSPWGSPGQNPGVGSHSLLQGIFPTQGLNPGSPTL